MNSLRVFQRCRDHSFSGRSFSQNLRSLVMISNSWFQSTETLVRSSSTQPNVIFVLAGTDARLISSHDLSWNSIGYQPYNLEALTTFLDKFAQNRVILSNYYTQESCTLARSALMTGVHFVFETLHTFSSLIFLFLNL